jgi:hypothetical protein
MHRFALLAGLLMVTNSLLSSYAVADVNQAAIADVMSGKVRVAKASWWGFDPVESTSALQAAINSRVPKLIVDNVGGPWIVDKITLVSNQEIVFEKGVEVRAKRGAFRGTGDSLFRADLQHDISLIGYGATLRMWRSDYAAAPYQKGEWRMALELDSCTNVRVYGLTLAESGGDGIYLGTAKKGVPNRNIHIKDCVLDRNYRQGISVINADNLLIENCVLQYTAGTAPSAGIDFEPNESDETIDCVMRNCVTRGNAGCGYAVYVPQLTAKSAPIYLRLENCKSIRDHANGLFVATGNSLAGAVRGAMEFVNCQFIRSGATGVIVANKPVAGCRMVFDNCSVVDAALKAPTLAPILLLADRSATRNVGGVEFRHCTVKDRLGRQPMSFQDASAGLGPTDVTGDLIVIKGRDRIETPLTAEVITRWTGPRQGRMKAVPAFAMQGVRFRPLAGPAPSGSLSPDVAQLRDKAAYVLYAEQGQAVRFAMRYPHYAYYTGNPIPITVTGPSGKEVKRVEAAIDRQTEVSFAAPETGLYRIYCEPGVNYVQTAGSSHPMNLDLEGAPAGLLNTIGRFYFFVPPGTKEFGIVMRGGDPGEAIKAGVYDPSGKLVAEEDNIAGRHQFVINPTAGAKGKIWSLRLDHPSRSAMEDFSVELQGIPPLLAGSPEAILEPVEGKR